ncbi:hypothetical protein B0T09DRAFT_160342 [Sordaria sp. MPI-SDFR-AT-0083]|nr:hypothetical protein B0T09DRAFT_160342 [Sordaria sp. MPI-SDFR-AT-0083]
MQSSTEFSGQALPWCCCYLIQASPACNTYQYPGVVGRDQHFRDTTSFLRPSPSQIHFILPQRQLRRKPLLQTASIYHPLIGGSALASPCIFSGVSCLAVEHPTRT